jgi:hypothetical protein
MHAERRREPRFLFEGRVWCDTEDARRYVRCRDVSLSGARLETLPSASRRRSGSIRWDFENERVEVDAVVVWTEATPGAL